MRTLLCAVLLAGVALCAPQKRKEKDPAEVVFNFHGILRTINNKELIVEPEEGNDMRFLRTKRTRFLDENGKDVNELEFKFGDAIAVEAFQKLNGDLEALRVRHPKPEKPQEQPQASDRRERLIQVGDQVIPVLQADRAPQEVLRRLCRRAFD